MVISLKYCVNKINLKTQERRVKIINIFNQEELKIFFLRVDTKLFFKHLKHTPSNQEPAKNVDRSDDYGDKT